MASQVLIIEDDEAISKMVAEVVKDLGLSSAAAKNGPDGVARFDAEVPRLVVLDLLLPGGMDGFRVAEVIRDSPAGKKLPIVVISGFYKDAKAQRDLQARFGIAAFLPKPFRVEDLRRAIADALGLRARAVGEVTEPFLTVPSMGFDSFESSLEEWPALHLFAELYRGKADGVLELTQGRARKRFFLQRGFFRYATSNVRAETLAGLLPARGVPEKKVETAIALARGEGLPLHEALVQAGVVAQKDLPALLAGQTEEVAITSAQWGQGAVSFAAGAQEPGAEGRANPVLCAIKAVQRYYPPAVARQEIRALGAAVLERTPDLDRELFAIKQLFPGEAISPMVNGRFTAAEALGRAREADLPLLYALVTTGLAQLRSPPGAAPAAAAPSRPASKPSSRPEGFTPEEEVSRALVAAEQRRQERCETHYQVLGIEPGADAAAIKAAYLKLARRFHADAFSGQDLGEAAEILGELFKRISEAQATLANEASRQEYDALLDRQAKGLPTDVGDILQADGCYQRATSLIQAGRPREAEHQLREAVRLNPAEPGYLAALAKVIAQVRGSAGAVEAIELLDKALIIRQDSLPALYAKGKLLLGSGDAKGAIECLRQVIATRPDYEDAMALLRQAKQGPAAGDKGGLLGKLFGGKSK